MNVPQPPSPSLKSEVSLLVMDLESTNGTFVNGERTARASLKHGDRLGVGRVDLLVEKSG